MAFMQIGSKNPNFTFILKKNPATGMLVRLLKEGHLFGYYSNNNEIFNIYFKDSDSEISYKKKDEEFEYINPSRYNSPEFVLDSISIFLEHIIKKENELDIEGYDNFLMINMINIKRRYLDMFQRYFKNISISSDSICGNNYRLRFDTKDSLKVLISFVQLFAFFNILKSRYLSEDEILKYGKQLIKSKAPYFVKYMFKVIVLKDRRNFYKYKKTLEESSFDGEKIEFKYGYSYEQRMDAIESLLDFKRSIVDFGCGEGNCLRRFHARLAEKNKKYYAIDKDEEMLDFIRKRIIGEEIAEKENENKNIILGNSFPSLDGEDVDVIMSEVIEHNNKDDAKKIIKDILENNKKDKTDNKNNNNNINSLIITTPNKDFNQFFFLDNESDTRCEDHKFEMRKEEFEEWIREIVKEIVDNRDNNKELKVQFYYIGDSVNSIPMTLGAKIYE